MSKRRSHRAGPRRITIMLLIAAALATWSAPARAASFDCAKAATAVEKTICADAELSKLDEELAAAYADALARAADPKTLKSRQRTWLRDARDTCADAKCVKAAYEARVAILDFSSDAAAGAGTSQIKIEDHPVPTPRQAIGFHMGRGSEQKICQGLDRGLREHGFVPAYGQLCGVPFPSDDPGFERLASWRDLNPADHMKLVREMFYWFNVSVGVLGDANRYRQMVSQEILPDLWDLIWQPSQSFIEAVVDAGRLSLQVNRFDYDNNGEEETVYRMTGVSSGVRYRNNHYILGAPSLTMKNCREAAPGWPDTPYIYAIEKKGDVYVFQSRGWPYSNFSFFRYNGKTFWFRDGWEGYIERAVSVGAAPFGPGRGINVCSFSVY